MKIKIISGGQTGIDRLALEVARQEGLPTGGNAPRYYMTDAGPDSSLKAFGLKETLSWEYPPRTKQNVFDSDGTILFGDMESRGCQLTIKICKSMKKPYLINPRTHGPVVEFVKKNNIKVLNIAGNRMKNLSTIFYDEVKILLGIVFHEFKNI